MAKTCDRCGKAVSFLQRLKSELCRDCQAEVDRKDAERARLEAEDTARREKEEQERKYAAALAGKATGEELRELERMGYLIAGNRLIQCPVCGHDRFDQQRTLMNTRAATLFNLDWADSGADTRICRQCTHVMWFARR